MTRPAARAPRGGAAARAAVLLAGAAILAGGCGPRIEPLPLRVEAVPGGVRATYGGREGARVVLLAGEPWSGEQQLVGGWPGVRLVLGPESMVSGRALRGGDEASEDIPAAALARFGDAVALQAVALARAPAGRAGAAGRDAAPVGGERGPEEEAAAAADGAPPVLAASDAWVVEGPADGLRVAPLGRWLLARSAPALVAAAAVVLALALLAWRARWPGGRRATIAGRLAVVGALLGALALRVLDAPPYPPSVLRGFGTPPLAWPAGWELGGDALERALGPGWRELLDAIASRRRGDEPVVVWTPVEGLPMVRAEYLHRGLGAEVRRWSRDARPTGLCVFTGEGVTRGEVLVRTEAGSLCRVGGP